MAPITRRRFLAAGAAAAAGAAVLPRTLSSPPQARGPRVAKCLSMAGASTLIYARHPNDPRWHGNREYLRDVSRTPWVKLWVSWNDLQADFVPDSRERSWEQLAAYRAPTGGGIALQELDAQVDAANADGLRVILTIYHQYPRWADPPDEPWAWFAEHLLARYRGRIDAFEPVNEPNHLFRPRERAADATVAMVRSAAALSARHGATPLLAPAVSDVRGDWLEFSEEVMARLGERPLPVPVSWSHHNYKDVKYGGGRAPAASRLLRERRFGDQSLWLTEGGYVLEDPGDPAERELQATLIEQSFDAMAELPQCVLWTQHAINDAPGNAFKSGLRDDFDMAAGVPGPPRPSWHAWARLPA